MNNDAERNVCLCAHNKRRTKKTNKKHKWHKPTNKNINTHTHILAREKLTNKQTKNINNATLQANDLYNTHTRNRHTTRTTITQGRRPRKTQPSQVSRERRKLSRPEKTPTRPKRTQTQTIWPKKKLAWPKTTQAILYWNMCNNGFGQFLGDFLSSQNVAQFLSFFVRLDHLMNTNLVCP